MKQIIGMTSDLAELSVLADGIAVYPKGVVVRSKVIAIQSNEKRTAPPICEALFC